MDSRSTQRCATDLPATVAIGNVEFSGQVRNVSLGGVFVAGPSLTIGTQVTLTFGGVDMREIVATCVTRWNTPEGSGLQFDGLRAVETYSLSRFIRGLERATTKLRPDAIVRPPV